MNKSNKITVNEVIKKFQKSISYYARYASKLSPIEYDDAYQQISLRIWKALEKYNKDISKLSTYLITVIKQEASKIVYEVKKKVRVNGMTISLHKQLSGDKGEKTYLIDLLHTKEQSQFDKLFIKETNREFISKIEKKIPIIGIELVRMVSTEGKSIREAMERLGGRGRIWPYVKKIKKIALTMPC